MLGLLSEYRVPTPPPDVVDDLINRLQPLMPVQTQRKHAWHRFRLLHDTLLGIRFMSVSFWIVTVFLYLTGYAVAMHSPQNLIQTVLFLTPIPLILSMRELFHGREEGVYELELSCRIPPQELMVARALTTLVYNMVLNTVLSLVLVSWMPSVLLWKITVLWLSPLLLTGAIMLFLCGHIRGPLTVPACLCCWVAAALFLSNQGGIIDHLLRQEIWVLAIPTLLCAMLYAASIIRLHNRYAFEGSLHIWN